MRAPEFWTRDSAGARALSLLLSPLGFLYGAATRLREAQTSPYRSRARVVCVGNLTAGGTGKTPVALALGRNLIARGVRVFFLTRGYGGTEAGPVQIGADAANVGDEALLLARVAPTIVARDRAAGAKLAERGGAEIIVMDDGFQNFSLHKDLSLLVVDAQTGFGNGRMIPAGPLRESVTKGLARADAVIVMGEGPAKRPAWNGPVLRAGLQQVDDRLRGKDVVAFAGIGRPERFFSTLTRAGARLAGSRAFDDHHVFRAAELEALRDEARNRNAVLVTTEKDFVRIPTDLRGGIATLPVACIFERPDALDALLDRLHPKPEEHRP